MLRSSNPILSKKDAFTPAAPYGQGYAPYPGSQPGRFGQSPYGQSPYGLPVQEAPEGRMTFDDVVTKTAATMGILVLAAAAAWMLMPDALYLPALVASGLIGFVVVMIVSFRRNVSPGLVLVYAAVEGVFIGMISKVFENAYNGIVSQAVIGTFAAAGVTLAAYKFFNIRVTPKFTKILVLATIAFAAASLINFVLYLVGFGSPLRGGLTGPVSLWAIGFTLLGAVLAVLNLVLDFDYIERGVAMGAPARESWRGAFGLTVTMVWLYVEILRLLSYLRR